MIPLLAQLDPGFIPGLGLEGLPAENAASGPAHEGRLAIFEGYIGVLVISFLVALLATPLMRRLAVANGVIDRPSEARKVHRMPIAYLGGVAVYLGILAGIFYSYVAAKLPDVLIQWHPTKYLNDSNLHFPVPLSILLGLTIIMLVGVIDDVSGISPRVKIGGQLIAAAALAIDNVGVKLAQGIMLPLAKAVGIPTTMHAGYETLMVTIPLPVALGPVDGIPIDFVYWIGTAIIAISVLGLCNASNLIDGLDGLLSGVTAIAAMGLLVVALGLAYIDDGFRDAQRIILCLALLGACLGFLPHNFNPATIFLGDAGSLMLGFCTCAIILTLGDTGKTFLVAAGLIIYAVPIIDTSLAIVRRKMEGRSISAADDQHLHHMLKRALGVKGAVASLYGIAISFAVLGAAVTLLRARIIYVLTLILAAFIGVIAIKIARKKSIEAQAAAVDQPAAQAAAALPSASPAVVGKDPVAGAAR
ncbi:MAG: undecaprenyl/decaprenyl-phosphate alpha-N-acetylglucosaminyl 1-phosphate transferase [Phycisphaeraceae bacterium]|nr:undecaprenyl/decaprenyl-phosphate alpha-N-acetylglucosaminyl 1-phosphate transferase [Phycisphaeraceae bacterium]